MFTTAPILTLPQGVEILTIYIDASSQGCGALLIQLEKVVAYASR